ncbi:MAG: hypothetical protein NPINA01_17340 [Nitrospinaceae bacterium]|nr:MAG: hypothetical protein NPINA01_17340 [Nitrospinaceae bacterium]
MNSKKNEFCLNFVLVVTSILFPILLIELFVTFVLDIRVPSYDPGRFFKNDPITGWSKKTDSEGYWYLYFDGTKNYVRNNSHGFTDRERKIVKSKPRIALIGDSTTEFWEAEEENRGQFLMEERLKGEWEVLNFGVRGFATDQTYLLLKHSGMKFSPDVVIYTFCINDIGENGVTSYKPYFHLEEGKKQNPILKNFPVPERVDWNKKSQISFHEGVDKVLNHYSFLYRRVSQIIKFNPVGRNANFSLDEQGELKMYKKVYDTWDEHLWALQFALILEMKRFLDSQGVRFLLVEGVYGNVLDPERMAWSIDHYGDVFDPEKVTRLLKEFSEREQIPFLSIQDQVKRRRIPITDIMHPEDYVHLNAAGIKLYSDWVLEKLQSLNWL